MFNSAISFYVDANAVNYATETWVTTVELYFKSKPKEFNNASGINRPGVNIYLCEADAENIFTHKTILASHARLEYDQIAAMSDASVSSVFRFGSPIKLSTNRYYAILVMFDDPDFVMWKSVQGDKIVGTNTPSSGPQGSYAGKYYEYNSTGVWKPLNNIDPKFKINVARFTSNNVMVELTHRPYEFLSYSGKDANKTFIGGEWVYVDMGDWANSFFVAAATNDPLSTQQGVITQQGNNVIRGHWATFLSYIHPEQTLILTDGTQGNTVSRKVKSVISDHDIILHDPMPFTNNFAYLKATPMGKMVYHSEVDNKIYLVDSTANSSVYITPTALGHVNITAGGSGYVNNQALTISGANNTVNATGVVRTNNSGAVIHVVMHNLGRGFQGNPNSFVITGGGSGATFTASPGPVLRGVVSGANATLRSVDDYIVNEFVPEIAANLPPDAAITATTTFAFENGGNTFVNGALSQAIKNGELNQVTAVQGKIESRSNELADRSNLWRQNKSSVVQVNLKMNKDSNHLYTSPALDEEKMDNFVLRNHINNDANNEVTTRGSAISKHISSQVSFKRGKFAEDIRVYVTGYRPANTDILVFAKIHNSNDPEAFDDKSWSPLDIKENKYVFSSSTNRNDFNEYVYGFPAYPETNVTASGVVTVTDASANVSGVGTSFVTQVDEGDVVRIYDTMFPETNYIVATVNSVVNATFLTLNAPVSNNGVIGPGRSLDIVKFPEVAFNNADNDNVVRYFNGDRAEFDTYDTFSLKIVMLSADSYTVPRIDDVRAIGVSI